MSNCSLPTHPRQEQQRYITTPERERKASTTKMSERRSGLVRLLSKSTSISAVPVKPGKTHPLSILDHAMARHTLHLVFYYSPPAGGGEFPMSRERMKESFSDVLSHYPAVTGRLVPGAEDGNWVVRCNDAGVRVLDAEVKVSMDEWFRTAHEDQEIDDLTYWEDVGEDQYIWSPFYIQISEFKDGGVAIGLSCPHMYADPTTATLLIKAWADAHRRACIVHPPFFHPPAIRPRSDPHSATASAALLDSKSKHRTGGSRVETSTVTFRFDEEAVRRILAEIKPFSPDAGPSDALAALFWGRIGAGDGMEVCFDFRKRMYAPLPHGFFGNAVHFSELAAVDGADGEDEWRRLGKRAETVRVHVAGVDEEEYWSTVDWLEGRRDTTGKYGEAFQMYGPRLTCVILDRLFAYDAVFNDRGPTHFSCGIRGGSGSADDEGLILITPHPSEGDGRTVTIHLSKRRVDEICRDGTIQRMGAYRVFDGSNG